MSMLEKTGLQRSRVGKQVPRFHPVYQGKGVEGKGDRGLGKELHLVFFFQTIGGDAPAQDGEIASIALAGERRIVRGHLTVGLVQVAQQPPAKVHLLAELPATVLRQQVQTLAADGVFPAKALEVARLQGSLRGASGRLATQIEALEQKIGQAFAPVAVSLQNGAYGKQTRIGEKLRGEHRYTASRNRWQISSSDGEASCICKRIILRIDFKGLRSAF
jgi:hypothetical protein